MNYFAFNVKTGSETKYLRCAQRALNGNNVTLLWPRRNLRIRRRGKWFDKLAPIFPGYLFLKTEMFSNDLFLSLRRCPGFSRFLPNNQSITPLSAGDRKILTHFLQFGEIVDKSVVVFDEKDRIRVISGPLTGMEGSIVKVDRRKGRVKVRLDLCTSSFLIDFGFEHLDRVHEK
jgi:transcriptional antiterminator NusG